MKKNAHSDNVSRITFASVLAPPPSWKHLRLPQIPDTICIPFYRRGSPYSADAAVSSAESSVQAAEHICAPHCFITTKAAGSMRFRWNEQNDNRTSYFLSAGLSERAAQVELIHSRNVIRADSPADTRNMKCDGIITRSRHIVPVITAADCMPVYLFEPETGVFGVVHSGWKGTGIAVQALKQAAREFGTRAENTLVVLGPHIQSCCYTVDAARAEYFGRQFTPDCISVCERNTGNFPFRLSLAAANIADLTRNGVLPENILCCTDCTCCSSVFGSFRRETSEKAADKTRGASAAESETVPGFTPMAAYCRF